MRTAVIGVALLAAVGAARSAEYRPNDVRPWTAYVEAKRALHDAGLRQATDAPPFMIGRLGPLPWRFEPGPSTPFKTVAVVKRMYTRTEGDRGELTVARVAIDYPEARDALKGEDEAIFREVDNISPREDGSKYLYELGYRSGYR